MTLPLSIKTSAPAETERAGASLARRIMDTGLPPFVALYGDLGVGKTAFVRGFTSEIAPGARVKSPTFALVNEYRGEKTSVFHFDMYRIEGEEDLYSIGFYDYLDRRGVCLVEWSENIPFALPDQYVRVEILKDSCEHPDSRRITITTVGVSPTELL
ncbi:MAG: tRNA (adenosine(37)-N6)-threonylcarbamoyltransferase complex ATPase subunit type 1 TsaE [Clostridia bacterium]|nr:tRNA (adenosine(37)-N6)-threonylcarbamoyltransferase complex ATPase subunit type 1 TsaE [Clostridia bacterium]